MEPVKPKKAYEIVVEQIQEMIMSGKLKKGQKLLAEREMAAELNVGRPTVRESLRALEVIGLIESRHGDGNFVKEDFTDGLIKPLTMVFFLEDKDRNDIIELRNMTECKTAELAAANRTDEEIDKLKELIRAFKTERELQELARLDGEFHSYIAEISRNQLVISVYNAMSSLINRFIRDVHQKSLNNFFGEEKAKAQILQDHQGILDAIIQRDQKKASDLMLKHLEFVEIFM